MRKLPFPRRVIDEAKAIVLDDSLWQRQQVQGITIDGPTSLDLDDAIWIEPTETGAIASIHITDVAECVPMGSALDGEAISRTQSLYFRTGKSPMLPSVLSENRLSLGEWQQRPTLTVRVQLSAHAQVEQVEIFESWLASAKKFSYAQADTVLADPASPYYPLLSACQFWSQQLNQHRRSAGGLGGMDSALGFWLDEEGRLMTGDVVHYHSHHIIQEFMILANTVVAQWLAAADTCALYRNHTARAIAPDQTTMLQVILTLGSATALRQQLQNWLNQAEYSPTLIGHFALNLPTYCHFTSPLRRCADLINHRIVKALLHDLPLPYTRAELEQLSQTFNQFIEIREETAKTYFKEQQSQHYQTQLQTLQALEQLSAKDFSRVLKYALESDNLARMDAELKRRLEAGILQPQDLYLLLCHSDRVDLQQGVLQYLTGEVQNATSVIMIAASQEEQWESVSYVEWQNGPSFAAWLEITIAGVVQTTAEPGISLKKQVARHHAGLGWLNGYLQGTLVSPEQRLEPQFSSVTPERTSSSILGSSLKLGENAISQLNHWCQHMGWPVPVYEFSKTETGFRCDCQCYCLEEWRVRSGVATSKRGAKQQAAELVLEHILDILAG